MLLTDLRNEIAKAIEKTFEAKLELARFDVSFAADPVYGDFATNAAMVYAKDLKLSPRVVAEKLVPAISGLRGVKQVEIAGPGFINVTMTDGWLGELAVRATERPTTYAKQEVVTEYSDPNPFKVLHVGHLYTSVVGDAISNLVRAGGGIVHPVNFGGDVGLHVGRTMWAILQELGGEHPEKLDTVPEKGRAEWMARCYVVGTRAYDEDEAAKEAIIALNQRVYAIHKEQDHESPVAQIYWTCRAWSYAYFDAFYDRIGSHFERYYPESETTPLALETVKAQFAKGVYKESDGAVVFEGEPYGLHTRVFITSRGLPTYEAKDVGLLMAKWRDYRFDRSIVITGNDILDYMKVVLKSVEQFEPQLSERSRHLTHGNVKLAGGVKMSSRKGNFLQANDILDLVTEATVKVSGKHDDWVMLGAVKYAFLKHRLGPDMVFVPEESVSLEGSSGPYLQYAHARARSILTKVGNLGGEIRSELQTGERLLVRKMAEYAVVLQKAVEELAPHVVAGYLYELAQVFNRFYETNRVMGDERQELRATLVAHYTNILKDGLGLLGIEAPERL